MLYTEHENLLIVRHGWPNKRLPRTFSK